MKHPLAGLSPRAFRTLYWAFLVATIACSALLQRVGEGYASKIGPDGQSYDVIAFEFAGTAARVETMKAVWGAEGIAAARLQTQLDYLFLLLYSTLTAAGIVALCSRLPSGSVVYKGGMGLAWGQWAAAALDAVENGGLLISLSATAQSPWPQLSLYAAIGKFGLLIAGVLFILLVLPCVFAPRSGPGEA